MERTDLVNDNGTIDDPNFDRKLDLVTAGAHPYVKDHLLIRITKQNCLLLVNYVLAIRQSVNFISQSRLPSFSPELQIL